MEGAQRLARGMESGCPGWRRAGVPQQVGVVLGQPERRAAAFGGTRPGALSCVRWPWVELPALREPPQPTKMKMAARSNSAREQPEVPQTAETCSSSATRKEEPQPQAATTFGFKTLNPAPCRLSS